MPGKELDENADADQNKARLLSLAEQTGLIRAKNAPFLAVISVVLIVAVFVVAAIVLIIFLLVVVRLVLAAAVRLLTVLLVHGFVLPS